MKELHSVDDVRRLLADVDWDDAIIRELVVQSPSYLSDDGYMVAPNAAPSLRLVVMSADSACASIELVADEVEEVAVSYGTDLSPTVTLVQGVFEIQLRERAPCSIRARRLRGRRLEPDEIRGWRAGLASSPMFDKSGMPPS